MAAAAALASRGRSVAVVERARTPGGRCVTRHFAPGFWVSPFADVVPVIPPEIFRALDLGRRGAMILPAPEEGRASLIPGLRASAIARGLSDASTVPPRWRILRSAPPPWPGEDLATRSLSECAGCGAPVLGDPDVGGSALALLAGQPSGQVRGGLGALAQALHAAALAAGADVRCGVEVTGLRRRAGRIVSVELADGSEIAARAVISTLDLKRTFLSLFAWNSLSKAVIERVGAFRAAPGIARLLLALEALPNPGHQSLRQPYYLGGSPAEALRRYAGGLIPEAPPSVLRVVSAVDPSLAPEGGAVVTVTMGAIAYSLFDGPWTHDKRERLIKTGLGLLDSAFPGASSMVKAADLLVPPDIETQLGLTEGDLMGGALEPSQMLSFRPFPQAFGSRTPVKGLYLAGPSSALGPLATCASGFAAALAVDADLSAGRLR